MACLNTLKAEIRTIAEVFPKNPTSRFQVIKANLDEITCRFIGINGRKHDIHANITVIVQLIGVEKLTSCPDGGNFFGKQRKLVLLLLATGPNAKRMFFLCFYLLFQCHTPLFLRSVCVVCFAFPYEIWSRIWPKLVELALKHFGDNQWSNCSSMSPSFSFFFFA